MLEHYDYFSYLNTLLLLKVLNLGLSCSGVFSPFIELLLKDLNTSSNTKLVLQLRGYEKNQCCVMQR